MIHDEEPEQTPGGAGGARHVWGQGEARRGQAGRGKAGSEGQEWGAGRWGQAGKTSGPGTCCSRAPGAQLSKVGILQPLGNTESKT